MKLKYRKYFIILIVVICCFEGCREEVIPPGNPVTNINEPVEQKSLNSYTFIINAQKVSTDFVKYPDLHSSFSRLSINLEDYSSGKADIYILNEIDAVIYKDKLERNLHGLSLDIRNHMPSIIKISCRDFTGRLKIDLSAL